MLVRDFEAWLDERGLVVGIGSPFYTVHVEGELEDDDRLAVGRAPTIAAAVEAVLEDADERQRQADERWAIRNPPQHLLSFEEVDRMLAERGELLELEFSPKGARYQALLVERAGAYTRGPAEADSVEALLHGLMFRSPPIEKEVPLGRRAPDPLWRPEPAEVMPPVLAEEEPSPPTPRVLVERPERVEFTERERYEPITREEAERALSEASGSIAVAARELGVPRSTLRDFRARATERMWHHKPPGTYRDIRTVTLDEVLEAMKEHRTIRATATALNLERTALARMLQEAGIETGYRSAR